MLFGKPADFDNSELFEEVRDIWLKKELITGGIGGCF
jgi:hypothetical protein